MNHVCFDNEKLGKTHTELDLLQHTINLSSEGYCYVMIKIITILKSQTKYLQTSAEVKRNYFIITRKYLYELPYNLLNDLLKTYDLRKLGIFKNILAMLGIEVEFPAS